MKKTGILLIIIIITLLGLGIGGYHILENYACGVVKCDDICWMHPEDNICIPCPKSPKICSFFNKIL